MVLVLYKTLDWRTDLRFLLFFNEGFSRSLRRNRKVYTLKTRYLSEEMFVPQASIFLAGSNLR